VTERIVDVSHEHASLHVDHGVGNASSRCAFKDADAGCAFWIIRRAQYSSRRTVGFVRGSVEVVNDLALVPNVIARSEHVDAEIEELFCQLRSHAKATCRIFDIGDGEIYFVFGN